MKVILDVSAANPAYKGGLARFTGDLIETLAKRLVQAGVAVVFVCSRDNVAYYREMSSDLNLELILIKTKYEARIRFAIASLVAFAIRSPAVHILLMKGLFFKSHRKLRKIGAHAIFAPTCVFNVYLDCPIRLVCIHDMQHEVKPENFSLATRIARWAPYRSSLLHATTVQASSYAIVRELEAIAGRRLTRKLMLIPEFYSKAKFPRSTEVRRFHERDDRVLFYPAQAWPHKNHMFLIRALGRAQKELDIRFRLVLCGNDFGRIGAFRKAALEAEVALDHLGVVSDVELLDWYASSWAVVLPTRYESSSLPAIEAFAVGALVIAADIPPIREFAASAPIVLFAENEADSFVDVLRFALEKESVLRTEIREGFDRFELTYELGGVSKRYADVLLEDGGTH